MEMAQHPGDAVSVGMFQMVTVFIVRLQMPWQVEELYQEVSIYILVSSFTEMFEAFFLLIEYAALINHFVSVYGEIYTCCILQFVMYAMSV
jgi:hypothetical protein